MRFYRLLGQEPTDEDRAFNSALWDKHFNAEAAEVAAEKAAKRRQAIAEAALRSEARRAKVAA